MTVSTPRLDIREYVPGLPITEPGIYSGVPMDVYHSQALCDGPSISSTGLRKIFTRGPKAFWCTSELNPDYNEDEDEQAESEGLTVGRAAHHLLLGEANFADFFSIRPEEYPDFRTKAAQAWRDNEIAHGRTVLTDKQIKKVRGMAASLQENPYIEAGILNGFVECTIVWRDKKTGIWLKARPDVIPTTSGDVADLKGTSATDPDQIDGSIFKLRYDMQGALTGWGLKEVAGIEMASFTLVFCEFKPPHDVSIVGIDTVNLEDAQRDLRVALDTFAWCLRNNVWFGAAGRSPGIRYAQCSKWLEQTIKYRHASLAGDIKE